ncbi:hypothetical protein EF888_20245 [Silicimonas algicola]|uniref:hypothetical protein n=1 Tax=Silicimonas algicola TaxID=1826607 RepID=UPI000D6BACDE|nr:hypothetical protein [Silicimonas algicola]AZQ69262.1 hypothetical protein EF888_20245 [Silicimonas algicola]
MNPKILFALALIALLPAAGTLSALSPSLKETSATGIPMDAEEYRSVTSDRQVQDLVEREILRRAASARDFNADQLASDFEGLGDDFSTISVEGGGPDGRDGLVFKVDNSDRLIGLVRVPGGPDGTFRAIIAYDEDKVMMINIDGMWRSLKFD